MAPSASAPCPHCKAENLVHRRTCWRCARTLPTSFVLDASRNQWQPVQNGAGSAVPGPREVEEALRRAVVVGEGVETPETNDPAEVVQPTRLLWMIRRRARHA